MTTLTETATLYDMDAANRRLTAERRTGALNEALDLVEFRAREAFGQQQNVTNDPTMATWHDMFCALQDILEVVKEAKGGVS